MVSITNEETNIHNTSIILVCAACMECDWYCYIKPHFDVSEILIVYDNVKLFKIYNEKWIFGLFYSYFYLDNSGN